MRELAGAAVAVFPAEPERLVYNNALLAGELDAAAVVAALDAVERVYDEAGVERFAVWAHESEAAAVAELRSRRRYAFDSSTRAMAMPLDDLPPRPEGLQLGDLDWETYVRTFDLPPGLLAGADPAEFNLAVARLDGRDAAAVLAYDHEGDCGIYNLGTHEWARRRGLGAALTLLALHRARERGCTTASLQSTAMAEGVYASLGFRDLGLHLEFVPDVDSGAVGSLSG